LLIAVGTGGLAMQDSDIPIRAPEDAIMAGAAEIRTVQEWAASAFAGIIGKEHEGRIDIAVRRQDHSTLHFGRSCMDTPVRIGQRQFQHGLGTHANSELAVTVPAGATHFRAFVGIDNNYDTQGVRGSVEFSVEIGGKEVFRTPTLRGNDAAVPVDLALPAGTELLVLKVDTTPDGPAYDQSDWADACFVMADGTVRWLDADRDQAWLADGPLPFSFTYGGVASTELLPAWKRTVETTEDEVRTEHRVRWADPKTGLVVDAVVQAFKQYPAVDWVLSFENTGAQDTALIEGIQALDLRLGTGNAKQPVVVHQLEGDACGAKSFAPFQTELGLGQPLRLAPAGGRPSSILAFPFFNLQYGDRGLIAAIGWSGQWAATLERDKAGPTRLVAGMELTRLRLHPGEKIRSPRLVLMPWQGSRVNAHNRWRRLLLFQYLPKVAGRPARLPIALQCFDRYSWSRPEWATEAGPLAAGQSAFEIGADTLWLDAAWFPGGFPNGVGNWSLKPKEFPNGLKPVSDFCHAKGLKFILWFEPERVAPGTQIAEEHPEFVFGGKAGGLYKLNDPAARRFLTDLLSKRIDEYGIDIYRNDFNIDPLSFWRANDAPDRQGMTEIRYVEGHYEMWDELRARHPGLLIDNCASGGRRIDIETCMRSLPLWRSDTSCSPGHPDWNQLQTAGVSQYIPFHTACAWTPEPYDFRSAATGGVIVQFDYMAAGFPMALAKASIAEAKENQKYWYGDFYVLASVATAPEQFTAYQFHRADLDEGLVLAFRHAESNIVGLLVGLQGVNPATTYTVEFIDEARNRTTKTLSGQQLLDGAELRIPAKAASLLLRYRPAAP
jgi:alpha-galactosidase